MTVSDASATAAAATVATASRMPDILREFLESDVLQHFALAQAAQTSNSGIDPAANAHPLALPSDYSQLDSIMTKLGYQVSHANHWTVLGFAQLEGPKPTELSVANRIRTARLLLQAGIGSRWAETEKEKARVALDRLIVVERQCEEEFDNMVSERKKLKPPALQQYREIGAAALTLLSQHLSSELEYYTQKNFHYWGPWMCHTNKRCTYIPRNAKPQK